MKMKFFMPLSIVLLMVTSSLVNSGCNKDDKDDQDTCENFPSVDGKVKFNNDELNLSAAQLIVTSFDGETIYSFAISGFTADCNKLLSVNLTVSIVSGTALNGTYQIKDFFSAGTNEAYGSFISQQIQPVSQTLQDLMSGTAKFTNLGNNKFTIELNAKTITNQDVTLNLTHTF